MNRIFGVGGLALAFALTGAASPSEAATIVIGDCYTGGCNVVTGSALVNITNAADVPPNDIGRVYFEITNNTNGYISELALFYQGGLPSPTSIEGFQSVIGQVQAPTISNGTPNGLGNISQTLNFSFDYANSNAQGGALRFNAGEKISFYLDAAPSLSALSFLNAGYIHAQGLPNGLSAKLQACQAPDADCDGQPDVPPPPQVPEPASLMLLGLGLLGAGVVSRRTRS